MARDFFMETLPWSLRASLLAFLRAGEAAAQAGLPESQMSVLNMLVMEATRFGSDARSRREA